MCNSTKYRAIAWRSRSNETEPVGVWRKTPTDARADALAAYQPHSRVVLEIEDTDGHRQELSDMEYDAAAERHWDRMRNRNAVGVCG